MESPFYIKDTDHPPPWHMQGAWRWAKQPSQSAKISGRSILLKRINFSRALSKLHLHMDMFGLCVSNIFCHWSKFMNALSKVHPHKCRFWERFLEPNQGHLQERDVTPSRWIPLFICKWIRNSKDFTIKSHKSGYTRKKLK